MNCKDIKSVSIIVLFLCVFNPYYLLAQQIENEADITTAKTVLREYKLNPNNSIFTIKGTSSLHDWEMVSKSFSGTIAFGSANADNIDIKEISITIGVKTLDSDNRTMNKKTYDALKNDQHPNIYYRFKSVKKIRAVRANNFEATLSGTLNIAGKTRDVDILVNILVKDNTINIVGKKPLKMSDFDVEPPTALLGTIKTGNDITIEFNLNYL
ncbi:MAG: YceI family protein [Altibacter sp.]|uniref:YceI family protein n=1 Tax=Altibacter sp. TaxID=2024823 RepID=UPI001DC8F143|nr:YceI family protein [Altibacter sp.]MBZ0326446.1 YceI family protein [Altibacter sp.]